MLHQITSSSANLRIQSTRRRAVRNLRAKVRALMPPQLCPKPPQTTSKRMLREESKSINRSISRDMQQNLMNSKYRNKLFEKLSKKQIEQINENKPYFLGNEAIFQYYDLYVNDNYPQMTSKQWKAPQVKKDNLFPPSFLPQNLIKNSQQFNNRKTSSTQHLTIRRASFSRSFLQKYSQGQFVQQRKQLTNTRQREKQLRNRKMAIQQQLKARRQISSMHLNRQISSALSRKQQFISDKIKSIKRPSPNIFKKDPPQDFDKFVSYDITSIAQKLRKICLINKNNIKK